jgi:ATP-dependent Clp protease ATP-binding subunit ClpA
MITRELELTFQAAAKDARRRRHETVYLEHLLIALLKDALASEILRACGADLSALEKDLESHLSTLEKTSPRKGETLDQSVALTRVLQRAAIHVQSAGKAEIDSGDVLAALLEAFGGRECGRPLCARGRNGSGRLRESRCC